MSAVFWTGAGGDNNWDDANNWNTGALPGPTDDVTIDTTANVVHSAAVTDSINSLTSTEPLTLSGGTLSIASASSTSGPLVIDGGTLSGAGDLTVSGLLTLTAGTISGSGAVNANAGISINPTGTPFALDGRTLTNAAGQVATWTGTGSNIQASDGAVFNNVGTFVAQNQGAFSQGTGAGSSFVDQGTFTKSTDSGALDFSGVAFNVTGGSVDVKTGTLGLQGGGTETGASFTIESGATLDFAGSTAFSVDSGTTFSGAGALTKDGPTTLALPGNSASLTGPTTVTSGTLLVDGSQPGSAVSVASGATLGGTGTVGAITTSGGTISPGDNGAGILNVDGNLTLDPSATLAVALDGPAPGTGYDQLNVSGTVNLAGSTLAASVGFSPSSQGFTIIRSTAPITPKFSTLNEGATLILNGTPFKLSYVGGNGDDVVLTHVGPVLPPQIVTQDSATFTVGTAGTFTVAAVGGPTPAVSATGPLPSGVTFMDNGDGTATLAGKPGASTGGTYNLIITASNGQAPNATEPFTLTVDQAPSIAIASVTPFTVGVAASLMVTTTGFPTATLSETGPLPTGVTFVDYGNGTGALTGKPSVGTQGVYDVKITAANGVGSEASQSFGLMVSALSQSPAITSASSATFAAGKATTFLVTTTGAPSPMLSVSGALPPGATFVDNGNGTATLTVAAAANFAGSFQLAITAANGVGTAATQEFTANIAIETAPRVLELQRLRGGARTRFTLSFDEPMNASLAQTTSNYVFRPVVRGRALGGPRNAIRVKSAVYDSATHTVTLKTAKMLSFHRMYQITVFGGPSSGLTNVSGVPLDGKGDGQPGTSVILTFTGRASLKGIPGPG